MQTQHLDRVSLLPLFVSVMIQCDGQKFFILFPPGAPKGPWVLPAGPKGPLGSLGSLGQWIPSPGSLGPEALRAHGRGKHGPAITQSVLARHGQSPRGGLALGEALRGQADKIPKPFFI